MLMPTKRLRSGFDWTAWIQWVFLTTLGWLLGILVTAQVDVVTDGRMGPWLELGIGVAVGLVQWIQLRTLMPQSGWWILASGIGWGLSLAIARLIGTGLALELRGTLIGIITGLSQWLLLRRAFHQAWWWIVTSALGWTAGQAMGDSLVGAVVGGITGVTLVMLVSHRRFGSEGPG